MLKKILLDPTPASAEVVAERVAICRACENIRTVTIPIINKDVEQCGLCSCPLLTKSYFKRNQCAATEPKW